MMGRTLAAIVAHPDDDTFGCAGTVALHAEDSAFRFVLVHATRGEAGQIAEGSGATRDTLGAVREEEDRRSWVTLGREPDRHEWLGLPDGGLADHPFEGLVDAIATILAEERPDVVVTFGPEGVTGHPDHITVGRAATEAFHRVRAVAGPGLSRLVYDALPDSAIAEWNRRLVAAGLPPFDPTQPFQPRGVPDATIGLSVDTSSVADRVLAALHEHRTQVDDFRAMSDDDWREAMSREWGVIAWPSREPGAPVLGDVFEGIDHG
jgi:LmbE family N-acetylglucosaminyl deacetylase